MDHSYLILLAYLIASILFIFGLQGLTHPRTAVRGNFLGAVGMLVAIVAVLFDKGIVDFQGIIIGLVIGTAIGAIAAVRVPMTAMPEFVALFNGSGGLASTLVAGAGIGTLLTLSGAEYAQTAVAMGASALIGAVTFTGSIVAFLKLAELMRGGAITFPGHKFVNLVMALVCVGLCGFLYVNPTELTYWAVALLAGVLGVSLVIPIGGADMPVVIALLNSYSGLAAAATGFVLGNNVLIISGSLVGASGIILSAIMCKAMNRSLPDVLFGTTLASQVGDEDDIYTGRIKATSAEEVAMVLESAQKVVFVPGYGLAVAQAQHVLREIGDVLQARGCEVLYGIHPVAGRMPGHMNVLLAEANVPYDQLLEMDQINPQFSQTDVVIVVGANDVVNPDARMNPNSPIAGMPILDVDKAKTVVVIKRSLSPGFAGIQNPLFANDNTLMFFGDGKKAITELLAAVKEL